MFEEKIIKAKKKKKLYRIGLLINLLLRIANIFVENSKFTFCFLVAKVHTMCYVVADEIYKLEYRKES